MNMNCIHVHGFCHVLVPQIMFLFLRASFNGAIFSIEHSPSGWSIPSMLIAVLWI